jgi:cysteinyl-tRNA synthetase
VVLPSRAEKVELTEIVPEITVERTGLKKYTLWLLILTVCIFFISCPWRRDYRKDMREFVNSISAYAKNVLPSFLIVPQNGGELFTQNGQENGLPDEAYLAAVDGAGREDLYYGYSQDDQPTPAPETVYMEAFLDIAELHNVEVLVTDYCWTPLHIDDSYRRNALKGYISFAADFRELHHIPDYPIAPFNVNSDDINTLNEAKNWLYLINTVLYGDKFSFLEAIRRTDYDLLIVDLFFEGDIILTSSEVESLKTKNNGGTRLILAYMSIGEAETYRYYWKDEWGRNPPFLAGT